MLNLIKAFSTFTCPVHLPPYAPDFLQEFPCQTNGMGKYKGEPACTHVDESINLLAQPHCQVSFHVTKQVEEKLKQLKNDDIVECAGLTPCVLPIVVVPKLSKLNKIRTCVDTRSLSKPFTGERHIIPTIDDSV